MKVQGKVIIVTGAGSGIGRELTLQLLKKKAQVIGTDINRSGLEETIALSGNSSDLKTFVSDVSMKSSVEALFKAVMIDYQFVDGIINNAGIIQPFINFNELDYQTIEQVLNVNLFGALFMTKTFLPHLLTRPEAHIVNVSSMGGFLPVPGQTMYGAAKAAVKIFTEGLQSELADTSVSVSVVFPGAIGTDIIKNSGLQPRVSSNSKSSSIKPLAPSKAAEIIISGVEANNPRIIVGKDAKFMDLISRINPQRAARFIAKKMKGAGR